MRRMILLFVAIALMLAMVGTRGRDTTRNGTRSGGGSAPSDGAMSPG